MTPETTMPDWLEPMAAMLTQERFTGGDWLFEVVPLDGTRIDRLTAAPRVPAQGHVEGGAAASTRGE